MLPGNWPSVVSGSAGIKGQTMGKDEETEIQRQILDLRVMHSQFTHSEDQMRMKRAADAIESLLRQVRELQIANTAFSEALGRELNRRAT